MATVVFLMLQIDPPPAHSRWTLGSNGLFTAILIALVTVRVQKFFADRTLVIRLPPSVPPVVYSRSCHSRRSSSSSSRSGCFGSSPV